MALLRITMVVALWLVSAQAQQLPGLPANCFKQGDFCQISQVVEDEKKGSFIRAILFVQLNKAQWSPESVFARFQDFGAWKDYVNGANSVVIADSFALTPLDGHFARQYLDYSVKAPFPLRWLQAIEVTDYKEVAPFKGALRSATYRAVLRDEEVVGLPDGGKYREPTGIKWKEGSLHIIDSGESLNLYYVVDVAPTLPFYRMALPYMDAALGEMVKGTFSL